MVADLSPAAFERGGSASRSTIAPDAETVRADPAKLHDALRNLVANAITYSPEGSTIRMDAERVGGQIAHLGVRRRSGHS